MILEDDPLNKYALKVQLKKIKYSNFQIVENYESYSSLNKHEYDCIILDLNFGHELFNGIDLAKELKKKNYLGKVCILTAESDTSIKTEANKYVDQYLVKPIVSKDLENILFMKD